MVLSLDRMSRLSLRRRRGRREMMIIIITARCPSVGYGEVVLLVLVGILRRAWAAGVLEGATSPAYMKKLFLPVDPPPRVDSRSVAWRSCSRFTKRARER